MTIHPKIQFNIYVPTNYLCKSHHGCLKIAPSRAFHTHTGMTESNDCLVAVRLGLIARFVSFKREGGSAQPQCAHHFHFSSVIPHPPLCIVII